MSEQPRLDEFIIADSQIRAILTEGRREEALQLAHAMLMQSRNDLQNAAAGAPDVSGIAIRMSDLAVMLATTGQADAPSRRFSRP